MRKSLKTSNHLSTCASNFLRIKKILGSFENDHYSFDLFYSGKNNQADFLVICRTPHTVTLEAKLLSEDSSLIELIFMLMQN